MSIEIRTHRPGQRIDDFLNLHYELFRGDPAFIAPLEMELRDRLTPGKNPFFEHAEAVYFTAWKNGRCVGRISAQIDHEHLRIHKDRTGFFGFFDTIDDQEVASALLTAAESWLRDRGMQRVRGPFSLSINEECGMLVDGFEHPPVVMMPHGLRHQPKLVEGAGYQKAQDLYAWKYVVEPPPERAMKAHAQITSMPEIRFRPITLKSVKKDVPILLDIFNDAWSENWGFVPLTQAEAKKMANDLLLLLDERIAFIVELHGRPVAVCLTLPNLNEAARDLGGKLLPFGIFKLLYRLKVQKVKSARLLILGIRKELRGVKKYGGLSAAMYTELYLRGSKAGYEFCELGWTLESNRPINLGIKMMGGKIYKTYRIYEKELG
ncbi:MAG: hypothetical protein GXY23_03195 [Myxococcales bacterium]|nr:hypothetical protein [Myxococcales bacterium]